MKIFLSALESHGVNICNNLGQLKWNLMSFYYLKQSVFEKVLAHSELMLIDSGAHSFQKGKKVDWVAEEFPDAIVSVFIRHQLGRQSGDY